MRAVIEVTTWWAVSVALWLTTVSTIDLMEVILAVCTGLVCALLARRIRRTLGVRFASVPALRWAAALPQALANDVIACVMFTMHGVAGRPPAGRRHSRPWPAGTSARATTWRASAAVVVSATPATLVLDVDPDTGECLLHTLLPTRPKLDELATP